jgi:acetyltransferase-like isoleucine patch superfamily enzyme
VFANFRRVLRSNSSFYRMFRQLRNRYHCWRYGLRNVHPTTYVMWGSHISRDLIAHEYCYIAPGCTIGPKVELGRYVLLAPQVTVIGADHCFDLPGVPIIFAGRPELPPTVIESDVWIGYRAIIMAGVRIGQGSIVATGAVVTKSIPPYEIWGGVPARRIKARFANEKQRQAHDRMLTELPREGDYCEFRF